MREIKLTQGKVALVDDEDYEELSRYKWFAQKGGRSFYAGRKLPRNCGKQPAELMHRQIMNCPHDMEIDHINGTGLDNRKINLRICTRAQNRRNLKKYKNNTSGYKGVNWKESEQNWQSRINVNKKEKYLGSFNSKEAAAKAYNVAAKELFGEFARLNIL